VSVTPRTDAEAFFPHDSKYRVCDADFARTLERELNAANQIIRQQQLLDEENFRLQDRIKRLEEAGDEIVTAMRDDWSEYVDWIDETTDAIKKWNKAKEAKP